MSICSTYKLCTVQLFITTLLLSRSYCKESINDKLLNDLWDGYHSEVRPVCGPFPAPVHAYIGIAFRQLVEMEEHKRKMSTFIWLRMRWYDCRLQWNTSDYDGVNRLTVPMKRVWVPDLTLYENAESKLGEQAKYWANIYNDGTVEYTLPAVVKSMCKFNVVMFPFDSQTCNLTIGTWMYNENELTMRARHENAADISSYISHGEWDLQKLDVTNVSTNYLALNNYSYSTVVFSVRLNRKPLFHVTNLILPSLLVNVLAIIGFLLPPESGEKLNMSITSLLSLTVFQVNIFNSMPHTSSNFPILAIYFLLSMVTIVLSIVCTVVVLNIHFGKHRKVLPRCMTNILTGWVGKALLVRHHFMNIHNKYETLEAEKERNKKRIYSNDRQPQKEDPAKRKQSGQSNGPIFNISRGTPTDPIFEQKNDSVYSYYPEHSNPISSESRGTQTDPIFKQKNDSVYSYYSEHSNPISSESRNQSLRSVKTETNISMSNIGAHEYEHQPGDTPYVAVIHQILKHIETLSANELKKQRNDLLRAEWYILAVFLDRVFLFTFVILGVSVSCVLFGVIA